MIYLYFIAVVTIGLTEGMLLIKKSMWKEFYTVASILGITACLIVLKAFGLSTPFEWLNQALIPVGKLIFKYH